MHDLNLAARYCDRIILMKMGSIRYSAPPGEVYHRDIIQEIYEIDAYISIDDEGVPFVLPKSGESFEPAGTTLRKREIA